MNTHQIKTYFQNIKTGIGICELCDNVNEFEKLKTCKKCRYIFCQNCLTYCDKCGDRLCKNCYRYIHNKYGGCNHKSCNKCCYKCNDCGKCACGVVTQYKCGCQYCNECKNEYVIKNCITSSKSCIDCHYCLECMQCWTVTQYKFTKNCVGENIPDFLLCMKITGKNKYVPKPIRNLMVHYIVISETYDYYDHV